MLEGGRDVGFIVFFAPFLERGAIYFEGWDSPSSTKWSILMWTVIWILGVLVLKKSDILINLKLERPMHKYIVTLYILKLFSAFLWDFSLWLDGLSSDGSLRHLTQPCCVALGRALLLPWCNHQYGLQLVWTSQLMPLPRFELGSPWPWSK